MSDVALITGGGGFLGQAIVRQLVARGDRIRSYSRGRYPELDALGVEHVSGDLNDASKLLGAAKGASVVYHVAAKAGVWGDPTEFERTNYHGTLAVIETCRAAGTPRLVYTSSPSVVFSGRDLEGVDERVPYPSKYEADYPRTKAMAERAVLAANGPGLATVALRPHLIWGPGDNHLLSRLIDRARKGQLRRIGHRPCVIDTVYVENAADAHLAAADRLAPGSSCAGKAYFISNGEPLPMWDFINGVLALVDLPPVTRSVPAPVARLAARLNEAAYRILGLSGEPRLTRFVVGEMGTAHWFDLTAARRDLGYQPRISISAGFALLKPWLREVVGR